MIAFTTIANSTIQRMKKLRDVLLLPETRPCVFFDAIFSKHSVLQGKQFMATRRIHILVLRICIPSRHPIVGIKFRERPTSLTWFTSPNLGKRKKGRVSPSCSKAILYQKEIPRRGNLFVPPFRGKALFLFMVEQRRRISRLCAVWPRSAPRTRYGLSLFPAVCYLLVCTAIISLLCALAPRRVCFSFNGPWYHSFKWTAIRARGKSSRFICLAKWQGGAARWGTKGKENLFLQPNGVCNDAIRYYVE